MLYLLYGMDSFRTQEKLKELVLFFQSRMSGFGVFRIDEESFDSVGFDELIRSQMLFEKNYVVVCENILENTRAQIFFEQNVEKISISRHIFIFKEEDPDSRFLELFKKHGQKVQEFRPLTGAGLKKWVAAKAGKMPLGFQEEIIKNCGSDLWCISKEIEKYETGWRIKVSSKKNKYNPFAICDAVAEKNNIRAWILFQQALMNGIDAEEIFWKIWWQIKSLLMIKNLLNVRGVNLEKETGLHPFVIKKNLSAIHNFGEGELQDYSFHLVKLYHDTRKGLEEFSLGLEKFLLNISFNF